MITVYHLVNLAKWVFVCDKNAESGYRISFMLSWLQKCMIWSVRLFIVSCCFGKFWMRINDLRSFGSCCIKKRSIITHKRFISSFHASWSECSWIKINPKGWSGSGSLGFFLFAMMKWQFSLLMFNIYCNIIWENLYSQ